MPSGLVTGKSVRATTGAREHADPDRLAPAAAMTSPSESGTSRRHCCHATTMSQTRRPFPNRIARAEKARIGGGRQTEKSER